MIQIDTKNILFVCGGAFDGIEKHIERRMNTASIGYRNAKTVEEQGGWLQYIAPADLKQFGLIPELIGRFPVLTFLNPLDESALRRILTEPKNALVKQYVKLFEMDGVKLSFEKQVLDYIVEKAMTYKLGARGLRSICEAILLDLMFEIPNQTELKEFKVTLAYARDKFESSKLSQLNKA